MHHTIEVRKGDTVEIRFAEDDAGEGRALEVSRRGDKIYAVATDGRIDPASIKAVVNADEMPDCEWRWED